MEDGRQEVTPGVRKLGAKLTFRPFGKKNDVKNCATIDFLRSVHISPWT